MQAVINDDTLQYCLDHGNALAEVKVMTIGTHYDNLIL